MWPFKRKPKINQLPATELNYTQLDITERFDDHLSLSSEDWIETLPMNQLIADGRLTNLPPRGAEIGRVYELASELSQIREQFAMAEDGVYCPICHIANVDRDKLRTPCPKCQRPLLSFGWT